MSAVADASRTASRKAILSPAPGKGGRDLYQSFRGRVQGICDRQAELLSKGVSGGYGGWAIGLSGLLVRRYCGAEASERFLYLRDLDAPFAGLNRFVITAILPTFLCGLGCLVSINHRLAYYPGRRLDSTRD
jgi:hypothetical protein